MFAPKPRLLRLVHLTVLDVEQRTLSLDLESDGTCRPWRARVNGCDYERAAWTLLERQVGAHQASHLVLAGTVGRLWATLPQGRRGVRVEGQLFMAVTRRGLCPGEPRSPAPVLREPSRWWSPDELKADGLRVQPSELADFADGYWGGWIPDGAVQLFDEE